MLHDKGNLKRGKIYTFDEKKATELLTAGHCVRANNISDNKHIKSDESTKKEKLNEIPRRK